MTRKSPAESPAEPRWIVSTLREVQAFFRRSRSTMREWVVAGMPGEPGRYDLREIVQWLLDRRVTSADAAGAAMSARRREAETRAAEIRVETMAIEAARLRGELVDAREISLRWSEAMLRIRERLQAFPAEASPGFPAESRAENLRDLADAVHLLLTEMSRWSAVEKEQR
jgi:phage terminase Nu1 subunit (DNA packaging protein)